MTTWLRADGKELSLRPRGLESLLQYLAEGTEIPTPLDGCGEGDCGSCMVLVDDKPTLSCLVPAVQLRDREIETANGLVRDQVPLARPTLQLRDSLDCGSCLEGFLVTATAYVRRRGFQFDPDELRGALAGQICPCGEARTIINTFELALDRFFHGPRA